MVDQVVVKSVVEPIWEDVTATPHATFHHLDVIALVVTGIGLEVDQEVEVVTDIVTAMIHFLEDDIMIHLVTVLDSDEVVIGVEAGAGVELTVAEIETTAANETKEAIAENAITHDKVEEKSRMIEGSS